MYNRLYANIHHTPTHNTEYTSQHNYHSQLPIRGSHLTTTPSAGLPGLVTRGQGDRGVVGIWVGVGLGWGSGMGLGEDEVRASMGLLEHVKLDRDCVPEC